jgi:hypothetical protein
MDTLWKSEARAGEPVNAKNAGRECLLFVGAVGVWIVVLPILAFFFYSPHEGGPLHLTGLLLKDLFVDLRLRVWLLVLAPYILVQLVRSRLNLRDFWS